MDAWKLAVAAAAAATAAAMLYSRQRRRGPVTVYLFPPTTCSRRVLMCWAELGCEEGRDFVIEVVNTMGEQKTAAHKQRHPLGKVPVLQDGDWWLFESLAICEYLCARHRSHASTRLLPPPGRERAEILKWVSFEATELRPHILKPYKERVLKPMKGLGESDEVVVAAARNDMLPPLDVMEASLSASGLPYFAGSHFTLADLGFMPYVEALCLARCDDLLQSRPCLAAWWQRCRARPTWQGTLARAKPFIKK